jgi:hypothetical protein
VGNGPDAGAFRVQYQNSSAASKNRLLGRHALLPNANVLNVVRGGVIFTWTGHATLQITPNPNAVVVPVDPEDRSRNDSDDDSERSRSRERKNIRIFSSRSSSGSLPSVRGPSVEYFAGMLKF